MDGKSVISTMLTYPQLSVNAVGMLSLSPKEMMPYIAWMSIQMGLLTPKFSLIHLHFYAFYGT